MNAAEGEIFLSPESWIDARLLLAGGAPAAAAPALPARDAPCDRPRAVNASRQGDYKFIN